MEKTSGFMDFDRALPPTEAPKSRVQHFQEFVMDFSEAKTREQAARCMDCGVPFCHQGCPLGNLIPDFNDAVYQEDWEQALDLLVSTNNFPEFTGRICPAPCEGACVLGINKPPVAIEHIEKTIAEKAFASGLIQAQPPARRSGKKVAVVGSGPAGLAAAVQLNQAGHKVTIFEQAQQPGGLLRYGIPDFKLEKWVVERRIALMKQAGIVFLCGVSVGTDLPAQALQAEFDAVVLCVGASVPRDLALPGRNLTGIHFAMDYLTQQNQLLAGEISDLTLYAKDKHVLVIGGGDTGSDCVGTANRQGAGSVRQFELMPQPPRVRAPDNPWPLWPMVFRTSSSHEEGCERQWSMLTQAFLGDKSGALRAVQVVDIQWEGDTFSPVAGTEREIPCELALLAVGFLYPEPDGLLAQLGVSLTTQGLVQTQAYHSSVPGIFAAGDMRRGQSLVVWAISEGREAARAVDSWLMGHSHLPGKDLAAGQMTS